MDFKYLYNPSNGICHPYSTALAEGRSDLVAITADELPMLKTVGIGGILEARKRNAEPMASVHAVVTEDTMDDALHADESAEKAEEPPKPKGVTVVGKIAKPAEADEFGNVPEDYTKYVGPNHEDFDIANLGKIPDTDLVRFANTVLHRKYADAQEGLTDEEKAAYYANMRELIRKGFVRLAKRRAKRANTGVS